MARALGDGTASILDASPATDGRTAGCMDATHGRGGRGGPPRRQQACFCRGVTHAQQGPRDGSQGRAALTRRGGRVSPSTAPQTRQSAPSRPSQPASSSGLPQPRRKRQDQAAQRWRQAMPAGRQGCASRLRRAKCGTAARTTPATSARQMPQLQMLVDGANCLNYAQTEI